MRPKYYEPADSAKSIVIFEKFVNSPFKRNSQSSIHEINQF